MSFRLLWKVLTNEHGPIALLPNGPQDSKNSVLVAESFSTERCQSDVGSSLDKLLGLNVGAHAMDLAHLVGLPAALYQPQVTSRELGNLC